MPSNISHPSIQVSHEHRIGVLFSPSWQSFVEFEVYDFEEIVIGLTEFGLRKFLDHLLQLWVFQECQKLIINCCPKLTREMTKEVRLVFFITLCLIQTGLSIDDKSFSRSQSLHVNSPKTEIIIPVPQEQVTLEKEQKDFLDNYKQVVYEPELTAQFKLTNSKIKDSFILLGEESSKFFIEITVSAEHDPTTQLQKKSKPIIVTLIDRSTQSLIKSYLVHKNRLIEVEGIENKLYEVIISLQKQENEGYENNVVTLHGKILAKQKSSINSEWLKQFQTKVNTLYDKGVLIFLDSLQKWDIIELSSRRYLEHQSNWKLLSAIELLALFVLSTAELLYLRRLLRSDIVVI